jgi:hypothetical protein
MRCDQALTLRGEAKLGVAKYISIYILGMRFVWDPDKAEINLGRHQVAFEEAIEAFFDPQAVDEYDADHSVYEHRYNLIGWSSRRLLFVVYTEPEDGVINIISARKAEKKHQRTYEKQN